MSVSRTGVAVVGAGITGLSVGHALLRRGIDFRVFESGAPGSGQSAGRTRVFRHGHDDERLIRLAVQARAEWERLEDELGGRLLGRQGVLICGPNVGERAAAFEAAGVPARLVDREGQVAALPVLAPPEDQALVDELGGSIDVRAAMDGLVAALGDRLVSATVFDLRQRQADASPGFSFAPRQRRADASPERAFAPRPRTEAPPELARREDDLSLDIRSPGEGVEIHTSEGIWSAERAILCPGAHVHTLASRLGLAIPLRIDLHTRASFRVREPGASLACLQDRSNVHGETVYAAPMPDGMEYAIGLGTQHEPPVNAALARLKAYVDRAMPGLTPEPASIRLCQTSIIPWGADAFAVWHAGKVAVLAGANLFKFAPLLGELLAEDTVDELSPDRRLGSTVTPAASPAAGPART